jgi:hypothetical protein
MTANINPETGIAYGYISARALDDFLVTELLDNGTDLDAKNAHDEWHESKIEWLLESGQCETRDEAVDEADSLSDGFWENYQCDEPIVQGVKDSVTYCSSWLGGALNFYIFHSPHVTDKARACSPCVPNAGNLDDMTGDYTCYDVPAGWRRDETE